MKQKSVEILAPAGSFESMKAAVAAGADAVYIGGSRFGARAYAQNPEEDRMLEAIDYVHLHGCKLYLTVNTLMKDREMKELYEYLLPYYRQGLDAVIVQDPGVFSFVRKCFPDLAIHASTQMTITGVHGARLMKELGAERIVTARELSLEEIHRIHEEVDIEIESFVHGALCYCYSGQCLFSSLIGGRSGNRGRCAQPCRLPYDIKRDGQIISRKDQRYVMSLKDLCTLDLIPELLDAGIYSLKIEGRMKSPRYTAGVTSIYRRYVDEWLEHGQEGFHVREEDRRALLDLFDRGGQTDGYYKRHNGKQMVVWKEKPSFREGNQELFDRLDREYVEKELKEPVTGTVQLEEGAAAVLTLRSHGKSVSVTGGVVQQAVNQPMGEEKIRRQLEKTGNTPFWMEHLDIEIKGNVFLPVQVLNELRREGLNALEESILGEFRREEDKIAPAAERKKERGDAIAITVLLENPACLAAALLSPAVSRIYVDAAEWAAEAWRETAAACHEAGKECLLAMPVIFRNEAEVYFDRNIELLRKADFDGVLIRSMEEPGYLDDRNIRLHQVYDYNMYGMNGEAQEMLCRMGAEELTWPVELNSHELEKLLKPGELIAYGRLPMMTTAQCLHQAQNGCDHKPEVLALKDRMGKEFAVKNHCRFCYNTIYNGTPLSLLGLKEEVEKLKPTAIRLQFTTESLQETKKLLRCFEEEWVEDREVVFPFAEFTRGHFKRGVE